MTSRRSGQGRSDGPRTGHSQHSTHRHRSIPHGRAGLRSESARYLFTSAPTVGIALRRKRIGRPPRHAHQGIRSAAVPWTPTDRRQTGSRAARRGPSVSDRPGAVAAAGGHRCRRSGNSAWTGRTRGSRRRRAEPSSRAGGPEAAAAWASVGPAARSAPRPEEGRGRRSTADSARRRPACPARRTGHTPIAGDSTASVPLACRSASSSVPGGCRAPVPSGGTSHSTKRAAR